MASGASGKGRCERLSWAGMHGNGRHHIVVSDDGLLTPQWDGTLSPAARKWSQARANFRPEEHEHSEDR